MERRVRFVDKRYGRSRELPVLNAVAAARVDLRNARLIRRKPIQAAVVLAERIIIANRDRR